MSAKILVVDDIQSITDGVQKALYDANYADVDVAGYCDEALLRVKAAAERGSPYQLVISDISFREDHVAQALNNGQDLLRTLADQFPDIYRVAFSVSDDLREVRDTMGIAHAYVLKGRTGTRDLVKTVDNLIQGKLDAVTAPHHTRLKAPMELDDYQQHLLTYIAQGMDQVQIVAHLQQQGIKPNSKSSVEKRLAELRDLFRANNNAHLVSIAKDHSVI